MSQQALFILGGGYTGRFLSRAALSRYAAVRLSSRRPDQNLRDLPMDRRIEFDLLRPETWVNVPKQADVLWCFPAAPPDLVKDCSATLAPFRRLVVLGSTSAYNVGNSAVYPPPWIDETALIDHAKPRVQGEEFLRNDCGATVLRVAGIYGPGRSPLDWIKNGRVGPSRKYVNLIHVEDLASICLAALEHGRHCAVYNVSDGMPRTWEEICQITHDRWGITSPARIPRQEPGKRIDIRKLREELQPDFRHPDLFRALEEIAAG